MAYIAYGLGGLVAVDVTTPRSDNIRRLCACRAGTRPGRATDQRRQEGYPLALRFRHAQGSRGNECARGSGS